jgi:hypothetical protein
MGVLSSPAQAHHPSYSNCCCFDASGTPSERLKPFATLLLLHSEHPGTMLQQGVMLVSHSRPWIRYAADN